jgi:hypothetical protein
MRLIRQEFEDVIYAMHDAATFDTAVAEMLGQATAYYSGLCATIAKRLKHIGGLRRRLTIHKATNLPLVSLWLVVPVHSAQ